MLKDRKIIHVITTRRQTVLRPVSGQDFFLANMAKVVSSIMDHKVMFVNPRYILEVLEYLKNNFGYSISPDKLKVPSMKYWDIKLLYLFKYYKEKLNGKIYSVFKYISSSNYKELINFVLEKLDGSKHGIIFLGISHIKKIFGLEIELPEESIKQVQNINPVIISLLGDAHKIIYSLESNYSKMEPETVSQKIKEKLREMY